MHYAQFYGPVFKEMQMRTAHGAAIKCGVRKCLHHAAQRRPAGDDVDTWITLPLQDAKANRYLPKHAPSISVRKPQEELPYADFSYRPRFKSPECLRKQVPSINMPLQTLCRNRNKHYPMQVYFTDNTFKRLG